ncbi:MAG: hypothetical protein QW416_09145 [Candidatus Nitrosocaldaceae archaeon]
MTEKESTICSLPYLAQALLNKNPNKQLEDLYTHNNIRFRVYRMPFTERSIRWVSIRGKRLYLTHSKFLAIEERLLSRSLTALLEMPNKLNSSGYIIPLLYYIYPIYRSAGIIIEDFAQVDKKEQKKFKAKVRRLKPFFAYLNFLKVKNLLYVYRTTKKGFGKKVKYGHELHLLATTGDGHLYYTRCYNWIPRLGIIINWDKIAKLDYADYDCQKGNACTLMFQSKVEDYEAMIQLKIFNDIIKRL